MNHSPKALVTLLSFITLLFASYSIVYAAGPNIITNGDFSNGLTAWITTSGIANVPGSCAAEQLNLVTAGVPFSLVEVTQCIQITTPPSGTWTFSVGTATASSTPFGYVAAYRFNAATNCLGPSVGPEQAIDLTANSPISGIAHEPTAQSVRVSVRLLENFGGSISACVDDISFLDSGGTATFVTLQDAAASAPTTAVSPMLLWLVTSLLTLLTLTSWTFYRKQS